MSRSKQHDKAVDFGDYLAKQLKDPVVRQHYDEYGKQLEIAYRILQLRTKQGLSQAELAKRVGTKQANIARLESGQQNVTVDTLQRIAGALKLNLKIELTK